MTIGEYLKTFGKIEIEILLGHILGKEKEFIFSNTELELNQKQTLRLKTLIRKRLEGTPVAYLLGYKYFCGLKFKVNKSTLIPRPETEDLVEYATKFILEKKGQIKLIDIGTGSGCIALTLKKQTEEQWGRKISVYAVDISKSALEVARINAKSLGVKINFIHSDLFKKVAGKYDVITANLPYVPTQHYKLSKELQFEPKKALTDGSDIGKIYRLFLDQVILHINKGAGIFLETDPSLISNITEWARLSLSPKTIEVKKDIHGLDRFVNIYT